MAQPVYDVFLRDINRNRTERLDVWSVLTLNKKFNAVGDWNLEIPTTSRLSSFVTPSTGILVQRDGTTIFSGPGGLNYEASKSLIKAGGYCDNVLLQTPTRPTPSLAVGPYPDEYDVATGTASSIMIDLVNRNIGPAAPTSPINWKISNLLMGTDPVLGASPITSRTRFDPLIIMLAELASTPAAGGLGFEILQDDILNNVVTFRVYEPQDKHIDVVFSVELHTAQDYMHVHTTPQANYFIVGGGDNFGINRTLVEGGDAASIAATGRVIAEFVDKRGVTDLSELEQELAELIAGAISTDAVTIEPTEVPSLVYGTNYDLGDYVTAVVRGVSYDRLIREVNINFIPTKGPTITPTIADVNGPNDDILAKHLSSLSNRLSNIEKNWNVPDDSITEDMLHPTQKWEPGDLKITSRGSAQTGWLMCNGAAVSRSVYSRLFSAIASQFGDGDHSTTFNVPNPQNRFPVGAGDQYAVGEVGGSLSVALSIAVVVNNHNHVHSHGLNNHTHASQVHTHPGSHSHGVASGSHSHTLSHTHDVNIAAFSSGGTNIDTVAVGHASLGSGTTDHHHQVDPPNTTSSAASTSTTSTGGSFSTDADNNVFAASFTGSPSVPSPNSSESDSTTGVVTATATGTGTYEPPYWGINFMIYTGVGA